MFKIIFMYLLFTHILGRYYLQKNDQTRQKLLGLFKHCFIYTVVCLAVVLILYPKIILAAAVLTICHVVIEAFKFIYIKRLKKKDMYLPKKERIIYIKDQITHLICIAVITYFIAISNNFVIEINPFIENIFDNIGISAFQIFSWLLAFLLIWKPSNIIIKQLLSLHKPGEESNEEEANAGGFIGFLERFVILILLSINQYSAIGLVLTAKSIARYDKISKDKKFAEYYLLGTLLSTLIALIVYFVIIKN